MVLAVQTCGEAYYQTPVTKLQFNSPGVSESSPGFYSTHLTPNSKPTLQLGSNVVLLNQHPCHQMFIHFNVSDN